jgi:hypothetical protein
MADEVIGQEIGNAIASTWHQTRRRLSRPDPESPGAPHGARCHTQRQTHDLSATATRTARGRVQGGNPVVGCSEPRSLDECFRRGFAVALARTPYGAAAPVGRTIHKPDRISLA